MTMHEGQQAMEKEQWQQILSKIALRRKKRATAARERRANATDQQKSMQRAANRERAQKRRENESPEQRLRRQQADAHNHRQKRDNESPEQRLQRQQGDAQNHRQQRENESPEKRLRRQRADAQYRHEIVVYLANCTAERLQRDLELKEQRRALNNKNAHRVFSVFNAVGNIFYYVMDMDNATSADIYPTVRRMRRNKYSFLLGDTHDHGVRSTGVIQTRMNEASSTSHPFYMFVFDVADPLANTKILRAAVGTRIANLLTGHTTIMEQPFGGRCKRGRPISYLSEKTFRYDGDSTSYGSNPIHTTALCCEKDAVKVVLNLFSTMGNEAPTPSDAATDPDVVAAIYGPNSITDGINSLMRM
jgi:hypothetical protein